jgi:hypothetical protein
VQTKKAIIEPERTREQKWLIDRALVSLFEKVFSSIFLLYLSLSSPLI